MRGRGELRAGSIHRVWNARANCWRDMQCEMQVHDAGGVRDEVWLAVELWSYLQLRLREVGRALKSGGGAREGWGSSSQ